MANRVTGFTLVELIIVILLISILAVTAGPSLFGRSDTAAGVLEHSLVNLFNTQQILAMQDTVQPCYGVAYTASTITALRCDQPRRDGSRIDMPDGVNLAVHSPITADGRFYFNANGCPVASSHEHNAQTCEQSANVEFQWVQPSGQQTQHVCIASQGYISRGPCP